MKHLTIILIIIISLNLVSAFEVSGEFEISTPSDGEETAEEGGGKEGSAIEPITELKNKSDNQSIDYNGTNKTIEEETPKEVETPWKIKESQTIFIIVIVLIIIVLFLLKRKLSKLFKGRVKRKPKKRKRK